MGRFPTKWYDFVTFLELRISKPGGRGLQRPKTLDRQVIQSSVVVEVPEEEDQKSRLASSSASKRGAKRRVANSADESEEGISLLASFCLIAVFGINSSISLDAPILTDAESLFRVYRGDLPNLPASARIWMSHPDQAELRSLCLQASRYAVRMIYERSGTNGAMNEAFDVVDTLLKTYHTKHHISLDPSSNNKRAAPHAFDTASTPAAWQSAMETKTDILFGLSLKPPSAQNLNSTLAIRTVRRERNVVCWVGRINGEACRGIWANLVMELLYLTNDDD
ncbi:Pecanex-like protein 4, partial [Thoreauomyces humboldtii]